VKDTPFATPSADTTPPTVTITAPVSGTAISGVTTLSADAWDNVGVVGVQFLVNGAAQGAEVKTPPYAISWDTRAVASGPYTITAVARDAAGNQATSGAVGVTVSNPTVVSNTQVTNVSPSGATITWGTNNFSDSQVEYGLTASYGSLSALNSAMVTSHSVALAGLNASTTYNYRARSTDSNGSLGFSQNFQFVTSPTPTTVTVDFDNPSPPGSSGSLLSGIFQGINFGTGGWRWETAFGPDLTRHIYFDSSVGTSRTFTFSPAPRRLISMAVFSSVAGTLTLSDNLGQVLTQSIAVGSMQLVTTGWTQPSTTVTLQFASGWNLGVDDITFRVP
jgi:hypothetical protein